jgi:hypothetical protein
MRKLYVILYLLLPLIIYGCVNKVILTESNMVPCTPLSYEIISVSSDSNININYGIVKVYAYIKNNRKKEPIYGLEVIVKTEVINERSKISIDGENEIKLPIGRYNLLFQGIGFCDKSVKNVNVHSGEIVTIELNAEPS